MSSYSARDPDPGSLVANLLRSSVRFQFRDRRPRYFPVRSRVGVGRTLRPTLARAMAPSSRSGGGDGRARTRTTPGRPYQVPGRTTRRASRRGTAATLCPCSDSAGSASSCSRSPSSAAACAADRLPRSTRRATVRPTAGARRVPRSRGAGADEIPGRRARDARFRAELHGRRISAACRRRDQGSPLRRRDVVVRGGTGGRAGGLPDAWPDRRLPGRPSTTRARAARPGPRSWARRIRRSPAARPPPRHDDRRAAPDGRRLASGEPTSSTSSSQRPARCADPGRHRCVRGCLMLKFVMRHGLVR